MREKIINRLNKKRENLYCIFLMSITIFVVGIYNIDILGNPYYSDESGYWAAAAWLNGIDWSPIMSKSPYYGWGYGLILAPLFIIQNTTLRFKVAVLINAIFLVLSFWGLIGINNKIFSETKKIIIIHTSGVAIIYSYNIAYSHTTMCESFLVFLFIFSVYFLIKYCETKKNIFLFLFMIFFAWQIATHLRTIIFGIAMLLALVFMPNNIKEKLKKLFLFLFVFLISVVITYAIKDLLVEMQYFSITNAMEETRITANDSILARASILKNAFSFSFWETLFYSFLGKMFYIGLASLCIVFIACEFLIKSFFNSLKKQSIKDKYSYRNFIKNYILFCFLGALALDSITLMYASRIDHIFYGRYFENLISAVISIGLIYCLSGQIHVKKIVSYILILGMSALVLYEKLQEMNLAGVLPMQSTWFAGIMPSTGDDYNTYFTLYSFLLSTCCIIFFYYILKKKAWSGLLLLAVLWTVNANFALDKSIYASLPRMNQIIEIADKIEQYDGEVYAAVEGDMNTNIKSHVDLLWIQFHLSDRTLYIIKKEDINSLPQDSIFVIPLSEKTNFTTEVEGNLLLENNSAFVYRIK